MRPSLTFFSLPLSHTGGDIKGVERVGGGGSERVGWASGVRVHSGGRERLSWVKSGARVNEGGEEEVKRVRKGGEAKWWSESGVKGAREKGCFYRYKLYSLLFTTDTWNHMIMVSF